MKKEYKNSEKEGEDLYSRPALTFLQLKANAVISQPVAYTILNKIFLQADAIECPWGTSVPVLMAWTYCGIKSFHGPRWTKCKRDFIDSVK